MIQSCPNPCCVDSQVAIVDPSKLSTKSYTPVTFRRLDAKGNGFTRVAAMSLVFRNSLNVARAIAQAVVASLLEWLVERFVCVSRKRQASVVRFRFATSLGALSLLGWRWKRQK